MSQVAPMYPDMDGKLPFSLSMLGWALNEEALVGEYIEKAEQCLRQVTDDFEVIIIEDGSTDRTLEIAREYQKTRPWLRVYQNERNRGPGHNTKRAISLATKDYLFWQTVDWAYDIRELMGSLAQVAKYEVLQGVRLAPVSPLGLFAERSDHFGKAVVSLTNYMLIRFLFRLPVRDYQNVTVYPRALIQSVTLETESSFTNPECLLKVWWRGTTIREISVPFIKREKGKAKGTRIKAIVAAITDILYWWSRWILLGRRPDKQRGRVVAWDED
jgi:glycosyltransferase involved in cell wall biosynthesis